MIEEQKGEAMKKGYPDYERRPFENLRELIKSASELMPDKTYLRYKGQEKGEIIDVSYLEFDKYIDQLGMAFYSLGLKGKNIAVIGETSKEWIATYLATVNGGSVIVPLDKELTEEEIGKFLELAEVSAVVYSERFHNYFETLADNSNISYFIRIGKYDEEKQKNERFVTTDELTERGNRLIEEGYTEYFDCEINVDDDAVIIFTSGTTGTSKGVVLSQNNIVSSVRSSARMLSFTEKDVVMSVLPIHHTYEMTCGILTPILVGATVCINDSMKYLTKNLQLFKPTAMILVPLFVTTVYKRIWDTALKNNQTKKLKRGIAISNALRHVNIDLRSAFFGQVNAAFGGRLKRIVCGGAALSPDYVKGFEEFGINLVQGYGITECSPLVSVCPFHWKKYASVGLPVHDVEVKIDKLSPEDSEGEIIVRGPNVMKGYYKAPELTREVIDEDGWFSTGDVGYIDEDGFVYITGRKKNIIILDNGKNVFPEELEEHIYKIDLVSECVVVGKPNQSGETVITAQIFPDFDKAKEKGIDGMSEIKDIIKAEIQELNKRLPIFKQIRGIEIRKTEFDKTTTKKIKRI